jgi:flagellar biosynthetic protein FliP
VLYGADADATTGAAGAGGLLQTLVGGDVENIALPLRVIAMVTVFSVVPAILLLTTCFPRLLIVLSFLRRALGTQDLPPNQVIAGLALILTAMLMFPVWKRVHSEAYVPLVSGELKTVDAALEKAAAPLKGWMFHHTRPKDLELFVETMARTEAAARRSDEGPDFPSASDDVSTGFDRNARVEQLSFFVVLPAFVLSELRTAFQMGFLIYLPFLVIDLAVSAILISMGMFMLPPILISLPLKVLVFVLVDGWTVVVKQLLLGLQG